MWNTDFSIVSWALFHVDRNGGVFLPCQLHQPCESLPLPEGPLWFYRRTSETWTFTSRPCGKCTALYPPWPPMFYKLAFAFPGFPTITVQRFMWPSRLESVGYTGCCWISLLIRRKLLLDKTRKANLLPDSLAFMCNYAFFELLGSSCTDECSKHLLISLSGPQEGGKSQERDLWGKAHLGRDIPGVLGWQHALLRRGED